MQPNQNPDTTMAVIAYIGPLCFVPLLMGGQRSAFLNYHVNQGVVNFIFAVALWIILAFFGFIIYFIPFIELIQLVPVVFMVIGIINASKGEMKPLPLIGGFTVIK